MTNGCDLGGSARGSPSIKAYGKTHPSAKPKTYNEMPRMATLSEIPKSSIVYCIPPV